MQHQKFIVSSVSCRWSCSHSLAIEVAIVVLVRGWSHDPILQREWMKRRLFGPKVRSGMCVSVSSVVIGFDGVTIGVRVTLLTHPPRSDADVRQVGVRVVFGRKSLFPSPAVRQEFALFAVPPLHSSVLEPNFHL